MAKAIIQTLEPKEEAAFLDGLAPYVQKFVRDAQGPKLAVAAYYQSLFQKRREDLRKMIARPRRTPRSA